MDALLASLERDAEAEIERVLADARARAAAVTVEVDERLARRRRETLARREAEARAGLERALASARHAARQRVLAARETLLERFFAELRALLPALAAAPAYRGALPAELARARVFAGDAAVTARCAPALAPALRRVARRNGRLTVRPDARVAAGFRLVTADATLEVDGTLEGRVERLRPRLALEALAAVGVGA